MAGGGDPMKRRNWRVCPPPRTHGSMVACEEYDRRSYKELRRVMYDYDWKWWDYGRPTKSHDKGSWKTSTKRRHQYRPVEM